MNITNPYSGSVLRHVIDDKYIMRPVNIYTISVLCTFFSCADKSTLEDNQIIKPNILFIAVDDLRPELGCYGYQHIKSPNIDRLAETGAVFTNHFVSVPTCGASRFSMLTGMLPKEKGHLNNEAIKNYISENDEGEHPETFIHHLGPN